MNWKSHLEDSLEDGFYFTKKERSKTYVAGQNKIAEGFTISKEVAIVEANIFFCLLNEDMSEFFSATSWRADTFHFYQTLQLHASGANRCATWGGGGSAVNVNTTKILIKVLKPNSYYSLLFLPLQFSEGWVFKRGIASPSWVML